MADGCEDSYPKCKPLGRCLMTQSERFVSLFGQTKHTSYKNLFMI